MPCSVCLEEGHNKRTCSKNRQRKSKPKPEQRGSTLSILCCCFSSSSSSSSSNSSSINKINLKPTPHNTTFDYSFSSSSSQPRRCGICHQTGHNRRTCPQKGDDTKHNNNHSSSSNGDQSGPQYRNRTNWVRENLRFYNEWAHVVGSSIHHCQGLSLFSLSLSPSLIGLDIYVYVLYRRLDKLLERTDRYIS